jgi:hypothetical protein
MATPPGRPAPESIQAAADGLAAAVARACGVMPKVIVAKDDRGKTIMRITVKPR